MFNLFMRLIENSVVMSIVIIVMLVLARATRKMVSARLRYVCWVVIAVGLLLPVRPVLFTVQVPAIVDISPAGGTEIHMPISPDIAYAGEMFRIETNIAEGYTPYTEEWSAAATQPVADYTMLETATSHSSAQAVVHTATRAINWQIWLLVLWGTGTLVFLLVCGIRHALFMKNIRRWARPSTDTSANDMLDKVCREVGVHRLELMVCPLVATPLVVGSIRPILILPEGNIEPAQLRLMLLHEVMHIRRGDNAVRLLTLLAVAAHWFNPLVHLMSRTLNTEAELACDAAVLHHTGDVARIEYGQLVFSTVKRAHKLSALASAMSGEGRNLKRRLANIIEKKHTRRGIAIACAVLMIGAVVLAGMLSYERGAPEGGITEDIGWQGDDVALDDHSEDDTINLADLSEEITSGEGDNDENGALTASPPTPEPPHVANPIDLEPTNQLVIYLPAGGREHYGVLDFNHSRIVEAINTFRRRYPDVEVIVERVGGEDERDAGAYLQRVSTELMAGTGPDIIFTHFFDDIHKTMESGLFMNLSPLWHRDADFTARDYLNPAIMDAGVYRGRRYVIPISFQLPLLFSEGGVLESVGFDADAQPDVTSFLNAITAAVPVAEENPLFQMPILRVQPGQAAHEDFASNNFLNLIIPLVDFDGGIALPYEEAVRAFAEAYQPFIGQYFDFEHDYFSSTRGVLTEGRTLFFPYIMMPLQIFFDYSRFGHLGYEPVVTALRNHHGQLHATVTQSLAVNANSENYVNAWKFIRLLLTQERQYGSIGGMEAWGMGAGMPVNMAALQRQIHGVLSTGDMVGTIEGSIFIPALSMEQKQPVIDLIEGITSAALPNHTVNNFLQEAIRQIYDGVESPDDAIDELQRRLRIYLTE